MVEAENVLIDPDDWETRCPDRDDKLHCACWYDGDACCGCGAPAMTELQKLAQGMVVYAEVIDAE